MRAALLEDLPLVAIVGAFTATAWGLSALTGYPRTANWVATYELLAAILFLYTLAALFIAPVHVVIVEKRSLRRAESWRRMAHKLFSPGKVISLAVAVAAFGLLMPTHMAFKRSIPVIHPFTWDPAFMEWDRILHFGRHPWEWLQPLLGHPKVTLVIDRTYLVWIYVMFVTLIWQAWHGSRDGTTRSRYLLSFALCWILLGSLAATLLSSAGPVYYADVTGQPSPYEPLLAYLKSAGSIYELKALWAHDLLWDSYINQTVIAVGGISAMPSLHIAIAVLQVLLGFSVNRWLGWAYSMFAVLIFLGSIHLAWHYAIDAYVSLVAVLGIWWVSGRITTWWRESGPFASLLSHEGLKAQKATAA